MEKIGKTQEEIDANQIFECRQITKNIVNFGVSEKQKIKIMELLSLELESRDAMKEIGDVIKKYVTKVNKDREEDMIPNKNKKVILT